MLEKSWKMTSRWPNALHVSCFLISWPGSHVSIWWIHSGEGGLNFSLGVPAALLPPPPLRLLPAIATRNQAECKILHLISDMKAPKPWSLTWALNTQSITGWQFAFQRQFSYNHCQANRIIIELLIDKEKRHSCQHSKKAPRLSKCCPQQVFWAPHNTLPQRLAKIQAPHTCVQLCNNHGLSGAAPSIILRTSSREESMGRWHPELWKETWQKQTDLPKSRGKSMKHDRNTPGYTLSIIRRV